MLKKGDPVGFGAEHIDTFLGEKST